MISGFFKSLSTEEYLNEISSSQTKKTKEVASEVLGPLDVNKSVPSPSKDDLNDGFYEKDSSHHEENKLTIRFKRRDRRQENPEKGSRCPLKKVSPALDSDSDIGLDFVEQESTSKALAHFKKNEPISKEKSPARESRIDDKPALKGESEEDFSPNDAPRRSNKLKRRRSSPIPKAKEDNGGRRTSRRTRVQRTVSNVEFLMSSSENEQSDANKKNLVFSTQKTKTKTKKKPPGRIKKKGGEDPLLSSCSEDEDGGQSRKKKLTRKKVVLPLSNSSEDDLSWDEEEHDFKGQNPRKKVKRKQEAGDNSSKKKKKPPLKLASIFVRESPDVVAARKAFLQSQAPEKLKKMRVAEMSAEALGHDYFNDFSVVPHVNYEILPHNLKDNSLFKDLKEKASDIRIIPDKVDLSGLLSQGGEEVDKPESREETDQTYSLPLTNKKIYYFVQFQPLSLRQSLMKLLKKPIKEGSGMPWTKKYAPQSSSAVLGNMPAFLGLKSWLASFSTKFKSKVDSDSDSFSSMGEYGSNAVILWGPHGCGKTSSVYALASELGLRVLEVNASSYRSGRLFNSQTHEATQSHRVERGGSFAKGSLSSLLKPKNSPAKAPCKTTEDSLLLVEDIDLFFEDGDEGFYQALAGVIGASKVPIVLTYSSVRSKTHSIPLPKIEQLHSHELKVVNPHVTAEYLTSIALREGYPLDLDSVRSMVEAFNGNIAQSLVTLQFYCLSSRSTCGRQLDSCFSDFGDTGELMKALGVSRHKPKLKHRPEALRMHDRSYSKGCDRSHRPYSFDRNVDYSPGRKQYSKEDMERMERLAQDFDNHSVLCEYTHHELESFSSSHDEIQRLESRILTSLYRLPTRRNPSDVSLSKDVFPVLRNMARSEDHRRKLNSKRHFLHYFHSQLDIPVSSEDLEGLCSQFNVKKNPSS